MLRVNFNDKKIDIFLIRVFYFVFMKFCDKKILKIILVLNFILLSIGILVKFFFLIE